VNIFVVLRILVVVMVVLLLYYYHYSCAKQIPPIVAVVAPTKVKFTEKSCFRMLLPLLLMMIGVKFTLGSRLMLMPLQFLKKSFFLHIACPNVGFDIRYIVIMHLWQIVYMDESATQKKRVTSSPDYIALIL
jgi:hypothetical protein